MNTTFGLFLRDKRLHKGLTLRDFSAKSGYDIGYISRIENGILSPPSEDDKLERLAKGYEIAKTSKDWEVLQNLADVGRRQIPKEIDEKVLHYLPAFFRKVSKKNITKNDVDFLIKLIKGEESQV